VLSTARATTAEPLAISTTGALPFSQAELEAAVALRARVAAHGLEAHVAGDGETVHVAVADRARVVTLAGERGADAARLVAFAILDVAGDQLDPPPAPTSTDERVDALVPPPTPAARAAGAPWSVALWAMTGTHSGGALELAAALSRHVRVVGSGGASLGETRGPLAVRAFPVHAGIAGRWGQLELRAGAAAMVMHASAARSSPDAIVGGGAAALWVQPIAAGFALYAGAGADGFATALDYHVGGTAVAATDRAVWWAGAALAREVTW
jgi:hypothetical protein